MILKGTINKVGKYWAVECKTLYANTQGNSKSDGFSMMIDWIRTMIDMPEYQIDITSKRGSDDFEMSFSDIKPIMGLLISQSRNYGGKNIEEIKAALGAKSHNKLYQHLSGKHDIGIEKLSQLMNALGYEVIIDIQKIEDEAEQATGS